jgi:hypothetical protein
MVFATACVGFSGHGGTPTVCVSVPLGTTISFDPGGFRFAPDCCTPAVLQEVTAIVTALRCLGITTVRTPGVCIAVATGSCMVVCFLLPQPLTTSASTPTTASTPKRRALPIIFPGCTRDLAI